MLVAIDIPDLEELPKSCRECPLVLWGEWHDHCAVTDKSVTKHIIDQTKPDLCPLRRVEDAHIDEFLRTATKGGSDA